MVFLHAVSFLVNFLCRNKSSSMAFSTWGGRVGGGRGDEKRMRERREKGRSYLCLFVC